MTDTRDLPDDDVRAAVRAAGTPITADARADLRARLAAAIDGDVALEPTGPVRGRPAWLPLLAAAAVVGLVVGAIALIARQRDADVVPTTDLTSQLVGRTWVVLDGVPPGDLPTIVMKVGADRPDVIVLTGHDGCADVQGEFRLDGSTVVEAVITRNLVPCTDEPVTIPVDGATLTVEGDWLTVTSGDDAVPYRAIESLPTVPLDGLDGRWRSGSEQFAIAGGRVTTPVPVGTATEIDRALADGALAAWAWDDVVVVRTPTTGFRLLEPVVETTPTTLLDELVGRTWVGVAGTWRTEAPTVTFDSLNREPGLSAVSFDDGCNTGESTFVLDGAVMTDVQAGATTAGCGHEVAGFADGTNLAVTDGVLAVTDTDGLTTFYVALDSLEPVPASELETSLDGVWEYGGATFSIDGDMIQSSNTTEDLIGLVGRFVRGESIEAWRYEDGLVVGNGEGYLPLVRSDLPYGGSPVVTTGQLDGGEDALIVGEVRLDQGCLVVTDGGASYPIVWQPGTTWDPSAEAVVLPEGVRVAMGQRISAGGGYHGVDQLSAFGVAPAGIETIGGCADRVGVEIAVVQGDVTIDFGVPPVEGDDPVATIQAYLGHLAAGRYADAAALLDSGALESERRSDLAPLVRSEIGLDDLASALQAWCEGEAVCVPPASVAPAGTGVYAATFVDGDRTLTGYFRAGVYEGAAEVKGLPPRIPEFDEAPVPCPTDGVDRWLEADLDADAVPETVAVRELAPGSYEIVTCNTAFAVPPFPIESANDALVFATIDPDASGRDLLLVGGTSGLGVGLSAVGYAPGAAALTDFDTYVTIGSDADGTSYGFGCEVFGADSEIGAGRHLVAYEYRYVGGTDAQDSSAVEVTVSVPGGGPVLDERTFELPGQLGELDTLFDPRCGDRIVLLD